MTDPRRKGLGFEREIVNWHKERGCPAERVPLSGAAKGSYKGDIRLGPALALTGECKRFKSGLTKLYGAFEQDGADLVFARQDRHPTIVAMQLPTYESFLLWLDWVRKSDG